MKAVAAKVQDLQRRLQQFVDTSAATQAEIGKIQDQTAQLLFGALSDENHPLAKMLVELQDFVGRVNKSLRQFGKSKRTDEDEWQLFNPQPGTSHDARRFWPLLENMPRNSNGLVFAGPNGGRLKADVIRNVLIREVLKPLKRKFPTARGEIGFEHARLHTFRHFFISQAFLGGASEGEIRSWVGHRNSRIIERYRHLRDEDSKRKMERIDFFKSGPDQIVNDVKSEQGAIGGTDEFNDNRAADGPGVPDHEQHNTHSEVPAVGQQQRDERGDSDTAAEVA